MGELVAATATLNGLRGKRTDAARLLADCDGSLTSARERVSELRDELDRWVFRRSGFRYDTETDQLSAI